MHELLLNKWADLPSYMSLSPALFSFCNGSHFIWNFSPLFPRHKCMKSTSEFSGKRPLDTLVFLSWSCPNSHHAQWTSLPSGQGFKGNIKVVSPPMSHSDYKPYRTLKHPPPFYGFISPRTDLLVTEGPWDPGWWGKARLRGSSGSARRTACLHFLLVIQNWKFVFLYICKCAVQKKNICNSGRWEWGKPTVMCVVIPSRIFLFCWCRWEIVAAVTHQFSCSRCQVWVSLYILRYPLQGW